MRIVFLNRTLGIGGAERQLTLLAAGLHERGHEVMVAVFYGGYPLERALRDTGVPIHYLDKAGRYDIAGFSIRLGSFLRRVKPDVIYAFKEEANIYGALTKPIHRTKLVWGVRAFNNDLKFYGKVSRLTLRLEYAMCRLPDLIIANSHAGLNYARSKGFPNDRAIVIPNGFDTERFRPDTEARQRLRAELGVAACESLIGLVGRLDPVKDYPSFLRAASLLAQTRRDLRFVCVGPGPEPYSGGLRTLADSLGLGRQVLWAGPRDVMPAVYNGLDLLVSSSISEGFSNVLGEAMACGTPCVATDVGDSAWVVGDCGEIVAASNPVTLAAAVSRMLDRIAARNITPGQIRGRVVAHFSRESLLDSTEAALSRL